MLSTDLQPETEPYDVLMKAALAVRHGDRPATYDEEHDLNAARRRRRELVDYSRISCGASSSASLSNQPAAATDMAGAAHKRHPKKN